MSSSRAYPLWIEEQIKKRCECVADRVIYLDIGGEDMLMFPNIGNRSKKISEILTQIITENICMSEITWNMENDIDCKNNKERGNYMDQKNNMERGNKKKSENNKVRK